MELLNAFFLSIILSMDALGIGLSYGIRNMKVPYYSKIIIAGIAALLASSAMLIGDIILLIINVSVAKIVGAVILFTMGVVIIIKSFYNNEDYDFDESSHIDAIEATYLGIALSLDAFAAGIGNTISQAVCTYTPIFIAVFQILFLTTGVIIGTKISTKFKIHPPIFETLSGILLIILAITRVTFF